MLLNLEWGCQPFSDDRRVDVDNHSIRNRRDETMSYMRQPYAPTIFVDDAAHIKGIVESLCFGALS